MVLALVLSDNSRKCEECYVPPLGAQCGSEDRTEMVSCVKH